MKVFFRRIHLWLSLAAGIVIMLCCLTGAILVFQKELEQAFHQDRYFELEHFRAIVNALNRAEDLRNQVTHSKFDFNPSDLSNKIIRTKITSKQKTGLKIINEETDVIKL